MLGMLYYALLHSCPLESSGFQEVHAIKAFSLYSSIGRCFPLLPTGKHSIQLYTKAIKYTLDPGLWAGCFKFCTLLVHPLHWHVLMRLRMLKLSIGKSC